MTEAFATLEVPKPNFRSRLSALGRQLSRPSLLLPLCWIALVIVASLGADFIAPFDPLKQELRDASQLPSSQYLLGTDELGRDVLSRLLHGGGALLLAAVVPIVVGNLIGITTGLLAGYVGGAVDTIIGFFVNVLFAIPVLVVILAVAIVTNSDLIWITLVFGVMLSGPIQRIVRNTTASTRELLFVDAARVAGIGRGRILVRHVLPAVLPPLIVEAFLLYGGAFLFLTTLSFLGIGYSPETPSWGQMVNNATQQITSNPWLMVPVGVALILTVLSLNLIGAGLLELLPSAQRGSLFDVVRPRPRSRGAELHKHDDLQPALEVTDLSISFTRPGGDLTVVENVSFSVEKGETLGLVGESGCGKTMTALALLGLLPARGYISSGSVMLAGEEISAMSEKELQRVRGSRIALVSQEPMVALDPCFTVGSQLREALRVHRRIRRSEADARAVELLKLVGIARAEVVLRSYPHQLSGGMAQRVVIAMALCGDPEVLVADEPTTALDVTIQAEILDLLRNVQTQLGTAIVLVTHDLGVVADICDRVVVMYAGQSVEANSTEDLLAAPKHPYSKALRGASPENAVPGQALATVPGMVPAPDAWPGHCRFANRCEFAADVCRESPILLTIVEGAEVRCVRAQEIEGIRA